MILIGVLALIAGVWWIIAPLIVQQRDPRLKIRNRDHFNKLCLFYRLWGSTAVIVGALLALAVS